ncbi:hypothetical protein CHU98_g2616 [Xylaria longipes]|nr:hypothetical protein CHU98_g2616 [Xylaria longipes]
MLEITRPTCSVVTDDVYRSGRDIPFSQFPHPRPLLRMADPNPSAGLAAGSMPVVSSSTGQQNQLQLDILSSQQETKDLELDFTPDNPSFVRARDEDTLYWSSSYKELSHPNLFTRAAKTRARLIPDLKTTLIKLSTSKKRRILNRGKLFYDLEPPESRYELRLTGHADAGVTKRILMTGCVWIQCSDRYSIWKIKKRLAELTWLESHAWAPVHIYHEPIVAAHSDSRPEDDLYDYRIGTSLGGGFQLHVDIARTGDNDSLCGCPCRSRITLRSRVVNESFSRVGGVLRINGSVDAPITTAHGILNYFIVELLPLLEESDATENQLDTSGESSDEDSDGSGMNEFFSQELRGHDVADSSHMDTLGYMDVSQLQQWVPLRPFDTITYIAQARQTDTQSSWDLVFGNFDADYALFRQIAWPHPSRSLSPNNHYMIDLRNSNAESGKSTSIEHHEAASSAEFETSYILLGAREVIPVQLFLDEVEISVHGVKFKTTKLRAPKILAQGTSGCWVVCEEEFCGVIIALYQFEPYALMLPATTVSRNLMNFGANIEAVSLPPTDYDHVNSDVSDAQPRSTTISTFRTLRILPPEASSVTQSEPATKISHGSASHDTPPSSPLREHHEPQEAHPHTLQPTVTRRPPRPSHQSHIPLVTQSPSVGTSVGHMMSTVSGSRQIDKPEATKLQKTRLAPFLEEPADEDVKMRLMTGRTRSRALLFNHLERFNSRFNKSESSSSSAFPS